MNPGATFADGNSINYASAGTRWLCKFSVGGRKYLKDFPDAAGVDGSGTKNFGFRTQAIALSVEYVAATETAVLALFEADQTAIGAGPSTLTLAGQTYQACTLEDSKSEQPRPCNGNVKMEALFVFMRRRLA